MVRTYMRFKSSVVFPAGGISGCGEIAEVLRAGLVARSFRPSVPVDAEFAHFIKCRSGKLEYELMIGIDDEDNGGTWEVSCEPVLKVWQRLLGRSEEQELGELMRAVHEAMSLDSRVSSITWYSSFGEASDASPTPTGDS